MRKITIIAIIILIAGCRNQSYTWRHPDHVPQTQFNRDAYECERDSSYMYMPPPISFDYNGPPTASGGFGKGFAQGWNTMRQPERGIDYGLFDQCMQARGYYKEKKDDNAAAEIPHF